MNETTPTTGGTTPPEPAQGGQGAPAPTSAAPTGGAPQTAPATPAKYWDRFDSESAAREAYGKMETEITAARRFVEAVSPYFDIDEATGTVAFKPEKLAPPKPGGAPAAADPEIEALTEFQRDPKGFIRRTTDEIVGAARKQADTEAEQRVKLIAEYRGQDEFFDEYLAETDKAMRRLPAAQRAQQGIYDSVYRVVRANDVDRIVKTRIQRALDEKGKAATMVYETKIETGGGTGKAGTVPVELTPSELRAAQGLGISPEKYAKNKAEMEAEKAKWGG